MRRDRFEDSVSLGRANLEAKELLRRHCLNGRLELLHGNSMVGNALGLPMGLQQVRCEYASPPTSSSHVALELAINFYNENCVACRYRKPTGEVPNLSTVADERRAEAAERARIEEEREVKRRERYEDRKQRRTSILAAEGYVVRELAQQLEALDAPAPRSDEEAEGVAAVRKRLVEIARHAPNLFSSALVDSLLGVAIDTADPAAIKAIVELVKAGRCPVRRAVESALAALATRPEPEAARLLDLFKVELRTTDLPTVLDRLIEMGAQQEEPWEAEPVPEGIVAAAYVDLNAVMARITDLLGDDQEFVRGAAADCAALLLKEDGTRVLVLGAPLVKSVRGQDLGYAGSAHPTSSAMKALAEAWRHEPEVTRNVVELHARELAEDARSELLRIIWFMRRWRETWDADDIAGRIALDFCLARLAGDWGSESADAASEQVEMLVREVPALIVERIDVLIGLLLETAAREHRNDSHPLRTEAMEDVLGALQRETALITYKARLRRMAEVIGKAARFDPTSVLPKLLPLLGADIDADENLLTVHLRLLDALEEAATPSALRDLIPVAYSALLNRHSAVRSRGIDLWVACARASDGNLPPEFSDLAATVLADTYVLVHQRMLRRLRELRLPQQLAPQLAQLVAGWAQTYVDDPDVLNDALWDLRSLAGRIGNEDHGLAYQAFALSLAPRLSPHDRQRFLAVDWPESLFRSPLWVRAAVQTLACPELVDYYNQRHEPILKSLLTHPDLISGVAIDEFVTISDLHSAQFFWRALEPIELLQSAGRWSDALAIANRVHDRLPRGREGAYARHVTAVIASTSAHFSRLNQSGVSRDEIRGSATRAKNDLLGLDEAEEGDRAAALVWSATCQVDAHLLLCGSTVDAESRADGLEQLSSRFQADADNDLASAKQRRQLAEAWLIAASLLRYDALIRRADPSAGSFLAASRRNAEVLLEQVTPSKPTRASASFQTFLTLARAASSPGDVEGVCTAAGHLMAPIQIVGDLGRSRSRYESDSFDQASMTDEQDFAVCAATLSGSPITDVLVVRPGEVYPIGFSLWMPSWPDWCNSCVVEPLTSLPRQALSLPTLVLGRVDAKVTDDGVLLEGVSELYCEAQRRIGSPPIDCPISVRLIGDDREQYLEAAGYTRLRLRPFDPSQDRLTTHTQTDERLLTMFDKITGAEYDAEDARAFCRLFAAAVRAAQTIMFERVFRRGTKVSEKMFHDDLERRLLDDPELGGRLTRRDAVAGGYDDLLHDDIIAELKVVRDRPIQIEDCARFLGQPTQYGVGRGSQLSILIILDHSAKAHPPGVIENYIGWLQPALHGLSDARYPSMVGVLIVNTNLPVPSEWSRKKPTSPPRTVVE